MFKKTAFIIKFSQFKALYQLTGLKLQIFFFVLCFLCFFVLGHLILHSKKEAMSRIL